jgi:hypothetical protein
MIAALGLAPGRQLALPKRPHRACGEAFAPEFEADSLTKTGAMHLAARLDAYWHRQGHRHVKHTVHPHQLDERDAHKLWGTSRAALYVVRSNLVNGSPPRRRS